MGAYENQSIVSIQESITNKIVRLYPNPSDGLLHFHFESESETLYYYLFDLSGRLLKKGVIRPPDYQIDLSDQQSGCYFLKLDMGSCLISKKIIVL